MDKGKVVKNGFMNDRVQKSNAIQKGNILNIQTNKNKIQTIKNIPIKKGMNKILIPRNFNEIYINQEKQYTPLLNNINNKFQLFLNDKKEQNKILKDIPKKKSKSNNKPMLNQEIIKNVKNKNIKFTSLPKIGKIQKELTNINKEERYSPEKDKKINPHNQFTQIKKNNPIKSIQIRQVQKGKNLQIINLTNSTNENKLQIRNNIPTNNNTNINQTDIKSPPPYLSYAIVDHPNKDYRKEMEDFHSYQVLSSNNIYYTYFSIFDGHGGKQVPFFLSQNFSKFLLEELNKVALSEDIQSNVDKIISSIKSTFEKIDDDIIKNKNFKDENGSTGTILLIFREPNNPLKRIIICANVGDSKGYLINKDKIILITKDHNCKDDNEVKRIKSKGGFVFQGRVFGSLVLTRSFGDKEFKQYGVISTPDYYWGIIDDNDLYAIIGSDGVWDVIPQEDIYEMSKEKMTSEEFAKRIIVMSIDRGTRDNITCCVIKLNSNE